MHKLKRFRRRSLQAQNKVILGRGFSYRTYRYKGLNSIKLTKFKSSKKNKYTQKNLKSLPLADLRRPEHMNNEATFSFPSLEI